MVITPPAQPAVDSTWLNLKKQASNRYKKLYRLYADSLTNMPDKSLNEGHAMTNRYAARMLAQRDKLINAYPQYEEALHEQYLLIYTRDLPRLQQIYKDYPFRY